MKKIFYSFIVYIIILGITFLIPSSEGYDTLTWKLFIGQFISIPFALITLLGLYFKDKDKNKTKKEEVA